MSSVQDVGLGVLLEIPDRTRSCFSPRKFITVLHERGADVEHSLHVYLTSFAIRWNEVGGGGKVGLSGPYLYYD